MTLVLGVSAFYHDSAAAVLRDGEIVASAQVSLSQEPGRRVVARSHIPMERIAREPTWRSFFFDPIPGSAGQRYVIVIQAMDKTPGPPPTCSVHPTTLPGGECRLLLDAHRRGYDVPVAAYHRRSEVARHWLDRAAVRRRVVEMHRARESAWAEKTR